MPMTSINIQWLGNLENNVKAVALLKPAVKNINVLTPSRRVHLVEHQPLITWERHPLRGDAASSISLFFHFFRFQYKETFLRMSAQDTDDTTKVYCTVPNFSEEAIYELLRNDILKDITEVKEIHYIIFMPGKTPLQISQYQYDNYRDPEYEEQWSFLIVDRVDAAKDGVLLCNLHPYHGFRDAVRQKPAEASMSCAALAVASINWSEVRESAFLTATTRIALYDNRGNKDAQGFLKMAEAVDFGVHYVVADPEDDDDEPPPSLDSLDGLHRYTAIELPGNESTDTICTQHQRQSTEMNLDPNRLAIIDDKFDDEGVLLVQVEPRRELRCKPPVGGELLCWNTLGFMTWEEMEECAAKHSESKQDSTERRFRYYRTQAGVIIASMEAHEVLSTFTRPRQESDGVDENGEMGDVEDVFVEELPWDYFQKQKAAEDT